ncbi:MAG: HYR domain-containing protein, partial [Woeseia sp.]
MRAISISKVRGRQQSKAARAASFLLALVATVASQAQTLDNQNQRYRDDITALGIAHGVSTVAGIVTPPPFDKPAELQEYGINIGMKFMPAAMAVPPPIVLRPAAGACDVRVMRTDHPLDPVIDYENMYGINTTYPASWGWLADGDPADPDDDADPYLFHYNTGSWLTIRRNFVNLDGTLDPGRRILFADSNDRREVITGDASELIDERFNIGSTSLSWEVENKLDGLFDVLLDPIVFFAEFKHAAKQAAAAKKAKRYARVWDDAAIKWARSLEFSLGREVTQSIIKKLTLFGIEFGANAAGYELTSIPTNVFNSQHQFIRVLDEVPPTITVTRQPDPFEATTLGGEFANRHFNELRALIEASDNCDRPVQLDSQPIGTRFWPVGKTTTMQWCGRDLGPTHANGGSNRTCADLQITVEDTLPPLVMAPPAINLITSDTQAPALGRPGVFDLADPDVVVSNDAPMEFPIGRTPVSWTATDSSGNSASATQWVSLKESNSAPFASAPPAVDAVSFERVKIELPAEDSDLLDGRYDQLSYRISDTPDNGFFVAPLFPFFIEDHRTHQINPDGTYQSFSNDLQLACEGGQISNDDEIPVDIMLKPQYISVNDDGDVWVLDQYHDCSPGSKTFSTFPRFAKFSP